VRCSRTAGLRPAARPKAANVFRCLKGSRHVHIAAGHPRSAHLEINPCVTLYGRHRRRHYYRHRYHPRDKSFLRFPAAAVSWWGGPARCEAPARYEARAWSEGPAQHEARACIEDHHPAPGQLRHARRPGVDWKEPFARLSRHFARAAPRAPLDKHGHPCHYRRCPVWTPLAGQSGCWHRPYSVVRPAQHPDVIHRCKLASRSASSDLRE